MKNIRRNLNIASSVVSTAKSVSSHRGANEVFAKVDHVLDRSFHVLEMAEHMKRELDSGRAQARLLNMMGSALVNGPVKR